MNRKKKILFLLFAIAYVSYHLFTLVISPLPWFDETFFASISRSYLELGLFQAKVAMVWSYAKNILAYGPVYFWLTSFSIKIFGFGIFQFRIVCLLFGFAMLFLFYRLLPSQANKLIFLALFSLDTIVHSGMHSGRMDTMAVSFLLLCIYFFLRSGDNKFYLNVLLSGLFAAAALLTTPRSGVFFIPLGLLMLYRFLHHRQIKYFIAGLIWLVLIIALYAFWFAYAFGSLNNFLLYYKQVNSMIAVAFYIPKYQYPLIVLSIVAVLYGFIVRRKEYFTEKNIISLLSILSFYAFIHDTGAYSIFIIPFYYLLIADGFASQKISFKNWKVILVALLLAFNVGIFSIKSLVLFSDMNNRRPAIADQFVAVNIPPGEKVIGDELFYYSIIKAGSDFQYINLYSTDEEREKYHREKYDYDYVIWSDRLEKTEPDLLKLYFRNSEFQKVGELTLPSNNLYAISRFIGFNVSGSYNCRIYKRVKG
ncbi:MAG: glycosyltransferase family 39 protein [Bacteroidetes bacterium]|nr:glycosyltransferase family 39 protein [Bacteroidota bacterium]